VNGQPAALPPAWRLLLAGCGGEARGTGSVRPPDRRSHGPSFPPSPQRGRRGRKTRRSSRRTRGGETRGGVEEAGPSRGSTVPPRRPAGGRPSWPVGSGRRRGMRRWGRGLTPRTRRMTFALARIEVPRGPRVRSPKTPRPLVGLSRVDHRQDQRVDGLQRPRLANPRAREGRPPS